MTSISSRFKFLLTLIIIVALSINCSALNGKWRGELSFGPQKLPLLFNFSVTDTGTQMASMDSPMQNAKDIPLDVIHSSSDSINIVCKMINASYSGKINNGQITGIFSQNGFNLPLILTPETDIFERRPQTPKAPFPYTEKDTVFYSSDGTELAGTLVIPEPKTIKKTPIVVMVTGSGPQNRDEEIFEHRPFAIIADYLARNGIASFRYDDRGVASSKGDFSKADIPSFKADAESAVNFVKSLNQYSKTGILGHSEGGTIAVLIAAENKPDFIVSLAGMVVPAKETLLAQNHRSLEKLGITGKQKDDSMKLLDLMFTTIVNQYKSGKSEPIDLELLCKENSLDVPYVVLEIIKRNNSTRNSYFDSLVSLDPTDSLKKIKCPVLAINGTKDVQVDAEANLKAFKNFVKKADIKKIEGLNHLLQHCNTGEITEYGEITETISPEVLSLISSFILGV